MRKIVTGMLNEKKAVPPLVPKDTSPAVDSSTTMLKCQASPGFTVNLMKFPSTLVPEVDRDPAFSEVVVVVPINLMLLERVIAPVDDEPAIPLLPLVVDE